MLRIRSLSPDECRELQRWKGSQVREIWQRARIVELASRGLHPKDIAASVDLSASSVRRWIRRFNASGFRGLEVHRSPGRRPRIAKHSRKQIVELLSSSPRRYGIAQDQWSLRTLARAAVAAGIVDTISHEHVRRTLRDAGIHLSKTNGH